MFLKKALEENPEHVRAQVHLGFQQFDDAKYADALATFQRADVDSLGAPSSAWQLLKVVELVICCRLRLDWRNVRKVWEHSGLIEERIYLGGYEVYRKRDATGLLLERQTLHVMDDARRVAMVETKTVDTSGPLTATPRVARRAPARSSGGRPRARKRLLPR